MRHKGREEENTTKRLLPAYYYDLERVGEGLGTAFCWGGAVFRGGEIQFVGLLIGRDGARAALVWMVATGSNFPGEVSPTMVMVPSRPLALKA